MTGRGAARVLAAALAALALAGCGVREDRDGFLSRTDSGEETSQGTDQEADAEDSDGMADDDAADAADGSDPGPTGDGDGGPSEDDVSQVEQAVIDADALVRSIEAELEEDDQP